MENDLVIKNHRRRITMPNNDLISRAAPLAAYDAARRGRPSSKARKLMAEAPAIDAVPVVHSTYHLHHREDFSAPPCECNNCHCEFTVDDVEEDCHYCPKCGAKMDGEEPACGPDYCEIGGVDDE